MAARHAIGPARGVNAVRPALRLTRAVHRALKSGCYRRRMNLGHPIPAELTDQELLAEVVRLAADERYATVRLVAALIEVETRRLHLGQGCSSLFVYCTRVLKLSEHAAYGRIEAARAARRFPTLLDWLERGDLTLTTVCLLAPHLTAANAEALLDQARGRSKRQVEEIVAALRPQPCAAATIRKLPDRSARTVAAVLAQDVECALQNEPRAAAAERLPAPPAATPRAPGDGALAGSPGFRPRVQPVAPARYKLQVVINARTEEKLRRARDLMRHANPSGDLAVVLDRALDLLVAELERSKHASVRRPSPASHLATRSRHIAAAVRREVWRRDGGQCAFVGPAGRCGETGFLEFHHVRPHANHGPATTENIELRCRAHNQYEATFAVCGFTRHRRPAVPMRMLSATELGPDRVRDAPCGPGALRARCTAMAHIVGTIVCYREKSRFEGAPGSVSSSSSQPGPVPGDARGGEAR